MYCYPQEIMLSMIIYSNYQIKRAYYPEHTIKSIRINNAAKFSSKAFNYYCMALDINVEYFCTYTKWITLISYQENHLLGRPLSQNCSQHHVGIKRSYTR